MRILGIDPSYSCTGWCFIDTFKLELEAGEIRSDPCMSNTQRIIFVCSELHKVIFPWNNVLTNKVFTESEANCAKGPVIDLAHLNGAIKYALKCYQPLSYSPSQARKIWFGKGKIPFDKKKESKKYCKYIRENSHRWLIDPKFDSLGPDALDACVIALAGLKELTDYKFMCPIYNESLVLMRLHDEKVLTKYKGKYSYGSGKKKLTFRTMSKLDEDTKNTLLEKYRCILEGTQLHNSKDGSEIP